MRRLSGYGHGMYFGNNRLNYKPFDGGAIGFHLFYAVIVESNTDADFTGNQHLRMLYAEAAVPMGDGDAYDIDGWPRPLIKRATMALINARGEAEAVKVICDHRDGSDALIGPGAHARA